MPKGRSYANDSSKLFEKGPHAFVEEGFVHDKTFTFKAKLENENDGVEVKETIVEKTEGLSGVGEINIWLAANQKRSVFAKIGSASNLSLQFDNGVRSLKGISHNIYAGIELNRSFTEKIGKAGLELFRDGAWSLDSKLTFSFSRKNLSLEEKGVFTWNSWRVNGFANLELANKPALNHAGLLLTWSPHANRSYFCKFERKNNDPATTRSLPQGLTVGWNANLDDSQTVGIEARLNLLNASTFWSNFSRNLDALWLVSEWRLGESTVKVKVNKQLSHAITVTHNLGSYGQYSLGVEMSEVGSKNKFKFGTKIDLNL